MELNQFLLTLPRTGRVVEVWQKGTGPDLVFLHGEGGVPAWTPELEHLAKSFRVTIPLFPGFGRSTGAEAIYGMVDALLHLSDVLRDLKISKPHLVGHSFGGMLAAEYATVYPNEMARLVLISAMGLWSDSHPIMDIFAIMPQDIGRYSFYDQRNPMAKAMSHVPGPDEPALLEMYVGYVRGLSSVGRLMWPIPERGLSTRLDRIMTPTLIVWGENNKIVSVHYAKEFNKRIAGSKMRLFKEAGHMVQYEHPRPLANSIAQFLLDPAAKVPERPPALREAMKMAPERQSQSEAMRIFVEKLQLKQAEKIAAAEGITLSEAKPAPTVGKLTAKVVAAKAAAAAKPSPAKSAPSKSVAPKAPAAKKAAPKAAAKKPAAKKPAPKKVVAKKPVPKKQAPKKPAAKKPVAKKPVAKKVTVKKVVAKKPAPKKPSPKKKKR